MKFFLSKLALFILVGGAVSASPTVSPFETPAINLDKRNKGGACRGPINNGFFYKFYIDMKGWATKVMVEVKDCLTRRGQCRVITNWGCDVKGGTAYVQCLTAKTIRAHCDEDAIWLAGGFGGVNCHTN